jgi:hypothetical protein
MFGAIIPEQMAVIKAAVERRGNELFDQARNQGRREPREAYLMDALAQICDEWLRGQATDLFDPHTAATEPEDADTPPADNRRAEPDRATGESGPSRRPRRPVPPGYLGLLRLDVEALQRGHVQGQELCEIAGLGPIPVSAAHRLLGDAVLKLVITNGVDVANVTHLGRGPTVAQKIAMLWGSPGCVISGCPRMAGIEHDHRVEWRHTRHTTVDELDRLCDHHHDLKSYKGRALVRAEGSVIDMVPPHDPRHPGRRPRQRNGGPAPPDDPDLPGPWS